VPASSKRRRVFGPIRLEPDLEGVSRLLGWSFGFPPDQAREWLELAGLEHVRVLRSGRTPLAALKLVPMGQFFGGASVPMVGLAGVGVAPEARGGGVGAELCRATVSELYRRQVALSTLYPSTQKLYRGAGWEVAGGRWEVKIAPGLIRTHENSTSVRPMEAADRPAVMDLYRQSAVQRNGELDRGPYCWHRVFHPRGESPLGFLVEHRGALEGYAILYQVTRDPPRADLISHDLCAVTARAARKLLSLLAQHKTLIRTVCWRGAPANPLLQLLPERGYEVKLSDPWMLRICHLQRALEARGYPPGMTAELHLAVDDDVLARNAGSWLLRVEGGRGQVTRGGSGRVQADIRALAALYTGHMSAETLALTGGVAGRPADLATATSIFASAAPAMTDMF
jgi:predicted acetyltransferase